jgi:cytochrome c
MKLTIATVAFAAFSLAAPAFAQDTPAALQGDAAAGEKVFAKCQTCHVISDADGNVLGGKNSKVGPNLYGLPGRVAGSYPDFKYGKSIVALGETGFVWDEASFVEYVDDPAKFLKAKLDDKSAKSLMAFKLTKEEDALNVYAYIASLSPAPAEGEEAPAATN